MPARVRKQMQEKECRLLSIKGYEAAFHRCNFLHLTGVRINSREIDSAIHFYEKCLANRLMENDFCFAADGSTAQKPDILENMMQVKRNVTMIGDFTDREPKLYTEKVAGGVCGCIGFVNDLRRLFPCIPKVMYSHLLVVSSTDSLNRCCSHAGFGLVLFSSINLIAMLFTL